MYRIRRYVQRRLVQLVYNLRELVLTARPDAKKTGEFRRERGVNSSKHGSIQ